MPSRTTGRDVAPYRQGMVLGLTMAEIMLLLVFCLLIAIAAALAHERTKSLTAESALGVTQKRLVESQRALASMQGQPVPKEITDDWRRLAEADKALRAAGLNVTEFTNTVTSIKSALRAVGITSMSKTEIDAIVYAGVTAKGAGEHDWPPIINLSEANGHTFKSGSAELSDSFRFHLHNEVVPALRGLIKRYKVDVVEVIGHTDEQRIPQRPSNLDDSLPIVMRGDVDVSALVPADNAGLGLARAVSITRALTSDPRLAGISILPLSGAQLIEGPDKVTSWTKGGNLQERRRIEVRVRRSTSHLAPSR